MKTSDIAERPILELLLKHKGEWMFLFGPNDSMDRSVWQAIPKDVPYKLALSKMRSLIKRGLIEGCGCGCRGDFEITEKGEVYLANITK